MIPRYEQKEMTEIWSDQTKFETYLEVELAVLKTLEKEKRIPEGTTEAIKSKAKINPKRIDEIEKTVKHDVIAFCTSITENLDTEHAKFFHYGVTSSDIIDSSLNLQVKKSLEMIIPHFQQLLRSLYQRAQEMKDTPCIGRSHGMYAEPMSFGQKLLGHYNEFARRYREFIDFFENDLTIQCSGAVGNYTLLSADIEGKIAKELGLKLEPVSTQVIPRDRLAKLIQLNALIASAIERLCVEIRHLHHSDINELHEGFTKGQKGSSIMPHKKNPISSENLTGIARVLRSHAQMALENNVLWHERDISHSSSERLYLPDNMGLLLYALKRLSNTVENLEFHHEEIVSKVENHAVYLSSYYLHEILKQTDLYREDLYLTVQKASFESSKHIGPGAREIFFETVKKELAELGLSELKLTHPTMDEIKKIYLGNVDDVFKRSLEAYPLP